MRLIGITQRVDFIKEYNETRDALDQNWNKFMVECGLIPIILPNNVEIVKKIIKTIKVDGFIFTGGNNLNKYGGISLERDLVEKFCIGYAISCNIPLVGVCRGMQFIQDYFDVPLNKIENHIGIYHKIKMNDNYYKVNSYHSLGTKVTVKDLEIIGYSDDKIVEAIKHSTYKIYGIMWHPERNHPFSQFDKQIFKDIFNT